MVLSPKFKARRSAVRIVHTQSSCDLSTLSVRTNLNLTPLLLKRLAGNQYILISTPTSPVVIIRVLQGLSLQIPEFQQDVCGQNVLEVPLVLRRSETRASDDRTDDAEAADANGFAICAQNETKLPRQGRTVPIDRK